MGNSAEDDRQDGDDDHQFNEREAAFVVLSRWFKASAAAHRTACDGDRVRGHTATACVGWEGATQQSLVVIRPCSSANSPFRQLFHSRERTAPLATAGSVRL